MKKQTTLSPRRRLLLCFILAAVLLPIYFLAVQQRDMPYLLLSLGCFTLFVAAFLRALFFPSKSLSPEKTTEHSDKKTFRKVCVFSLLWTLFLWLSMALFISLVRHPDLPFWDALYADLSVNLDTRHYLNIAQNGYVPEVNIDSQYIIVFFPLFGWLVRLLTLGSGYVNHFITASVLNILFCALLGPVLYKLARLDTSPRTAARAVRYLYLFPFALFLVTPMTESLFLLLGLLYIYCLRTKKWWWLLPLGLGASLCRLQGCLLAIASFVEYLQRFIGIMQNKYPVSHDPLIKTSPAPLSFLSKFWRRLTKGATRPNRETRQWELRKPLPHPPDSKVKRVGMLVGEALYSISGLAGGVGVYLLINHYYYQDIFHFLSIQKGHWGQSLGFFFNTPAYLLQYLQQWLPERFSSVVGVSIPNLLVIFVVLLLFLAGGRRIRFSYMVYALAYFAVTIGATWLLSAPRYMVVLFPLALITAALTEDIWYDRLVTTVWMLLFLGYLSIFLLKFPIY